MTVVDHLKANKIISQDALLWDALEVIADINAHGLETALRSATSRAKLLRHRDDGYSVLHRVADSCNAETARALLKTTFNGKSVYDIIHKWNDGQKIRKTTAGEALEHRIRFIEHVTRLRK